LEVLLRLAFVTIEPEEVGQRKKEFLSEREQLAMRVRQHFFHKENLASLVSYIPKCSTLVHKCNTDVSQVEAFPYL
jgi:hypothetical protein